MIPRTIHVYPIDDLKPHEIEGKPCWCNPAINTGEITPWGYQMYAAPVIVHNAADGREFAEEALRTVRANSQRFVDWGGEEGVT